jgi:signal transduction histidine kinase
MGAALKLVKETLEGQGEVSPEKEQAIRNYVATAENLDDTTFHAFVQKMGVDPHEAEEIVYRYVRELVGKKG